MILYLNLLTSLIMATTDTASSPRFTPQDLPYAYDALAPAISEETMHYTTTSIMLVMSTN